MRKLNLKQFLAGSAALTVISAGTADAGLLLADRTGMLIVDPDWYLNAPLAVWFAAGTYISLALTGRILRDLDGRPDPIQTISASPSSRAIPWQSGSQAGTIFASAVQSIFSQPDPDPEPQQQPTVVWLVPIDDQTVKVRKHELETFLTAASRRPKHQLSRRYWVQTKRIWIYRYKAYVRLLTEAGLVEGRQHGSSGRLVTDVRHCLRILSGHSAYRLA